MRAGVGPALFQGGRGPALWGSGGPAVATHHLSWKASAAHDTPTVVSAGIRPVDADHSDGHHRRVPLGTDPESSRRFFRSLRLLREQLASRFPQADWDELSMGTSADYKVAVEEGATLVRVGTAIVGARKYKSDTKREAEA